QAVLAPTASQVPLHHLGRRRRPPLRRGWPESAAWSAAGGGGAAGAGGGAAGAEASAPTGPARKPVSDVMGLLLSRRWGASCAGSGRSVPGRQWVGRPRPPPRPPTPEQ